MLGGDFDRDFWANIYRLFGCSGIIVFILIIIAIVICKIWIRELLVQ